MYSNIRQFTLEAEDNCCVCGVELSKGEEVTLADCETGEIMVCMNEECQQELKEVDNG